MHRLFDPEKLEKFHSIQIGKLYRWLAGGPRYMLILDKDSDLQTVTLVTDKRIMQGIPFYILFSSQTDEFCMEEVEKPNV